MVELSEEQMLKRRRKALRRRQLAEEKDEKEKVDGCCSEFIGAIVPLFFVLESFQTSISPLNSINSQTL